MRRAMRGLGLGLLVVGASGCVFSSNFCEEFPDRCGGVGGASTTSDASSSSTECTPADVSNCPTPPNDCDEPVCDALGACGVGPKAAHAGCMTAGPQQDGAGVCTGASVCVGCLGVEDCPLDGMGQPQLCPSSGAQANTCVPAGCTNMTKDGVETDVDCGGGGTTPCPGCVNDKLCMVNTDCASGSCQAGLCKPCASQGDCEAVNYCDTAATPTPACKLKEVQGTACTLGDDQCGTDHCVDGFCCDTSCGSTCSSCAAASTAAADGTCAAIDLGTDPDGECDLLGNGCKSGTCDGAGACGFKAAGSMCGSGPTCVNGTTSNPQDVCAGGVDTCIAGSNMMCQAKYACTGTACNTACTTDAQCVLPNHCELTTGSPQINDCVTCTSDVHCIGGLHCEQAFNAFEDTCVQCAQSSGPFPGPNAHCLTSTRGKGCVNGTDLCGCSPATEAQTCSGLPPHCATSGVDVNSCVECDTDAHCSANNAGHDCSPPGGLPNKCGCDASSDCNGIGPGQCNVSAHTCQECTSDTQCNTNPKGHDCLPTNVCGCNSSADCSGIGPGQCDLGVGVCEECSNDSDCNFNDKGHDCSPAGGTANTCGCDSPSDCNGIGVMQCNLATHACIP